MTTLRLLGGASIDGPDGTVWTGPAAQPRRLALLAVLAVSGGAVSRERLVALLWPESTPVRARHLLADNLYVINRELEGEPVETAGDGLRLNPRALTSDVATFEEALRSGEPARAVELYGGPFLDGFFLRGSVEFDDWSRAERERFERHHREALVALAESAPDPESGVEWWRRLVASDPYDARWRTGLMEALARSGNRAGALGEARSHGALLAAEFGAEPESSVEALAARIRDGALGPEDVAAVGPAAEPATERESTALAAAPFPATRSFLVRRRGPLLAIVSAAALVGLVLVSIDRMGVGSDPVGEPPERSIAVLPLANLSGDPGQEYFADGMTEEIIGHLAKIEGLTVISRTSVMPYKDSDKSLREIARELGVATVLEGSVRREGDQVRVTAQLVDASADANLWSQTYDRNLESVFAIQSEVATSIARALAIELSSSELSRIERAPTRSPEAHRLYLRGRYFWNRRTPEDLRRALDLFERAVEIDPEFAAAHAAIAETFVVYPVFGPPDFPALEVKRRAEAAALRALELDPANGAAYAALGSLARDRWEWARAETLFQRAIAANPGYATARQWYANYLRTVGRTRQAVVQAERAHELDPQSMIVLTALAASYTKDRRYTDAVETASAAAEMTDEVSMPHIVLVMALERAGRLEEAIEAAARIAEIEFGPERARELRDHLRRSWREQGSRGYWEVMSSFHLEVKGVEFRRAAVARLALGDREGALELLERQVDQAESMRKGYSIFFDPGFDPLRDDPRFHQLLARMGLE